MTDRPEQRARGGERGSRVALRAWLVALTFTAFLAGAAAAQVGYDPARSPYRDTQKGITVRLVGGYLWGDRGNVGVGPADGGLLGLRAEFPFGNLLGLSAGLAYAGTDAYYIIPFDSNPTLKGPESQPLVLADIGLRATLTGSKSWKRLAPYVGGAIGFAFGQRIPADSSGYDFGTKFTMTPEVGVKVYLARRLNVDVNMRFMVWKLSYPVTYRPRVVPFSKDLSDWTWIPGLAVGVGWTF